MFIVTYLIKREEGLIVKKMSGIKCSVIKMCSEVFTGSIFVRNCGNELLFVFLRIRRE